MAKARTQIVDYTRMRKGKTTRWFRGAPSAHVDYCPVCGRKGSVGDKRVYADGDGCLWASNFTHKEQVRVLGGFAFTESLDSCQPQIPFLRLYNAGWLRSRDARRKARREIPNSDWPALPYEEN